MFKTKKAFESYFRREIIPAIRKEYERDGRVDVPARREIWNNVIDSLIKSNEAPERAEEWNCPW